jgi:UDP-GlcNAc:undecaprenyl-phosphate GlcNAc-1-phosphate transferase
MTEGFSMSFSSWYVIYAYAFLAAFIVSIVFTALIRRLALHWNIVDKPGERKMHTAPMPLMGGIAIFLAFNIAIFGNLLLIGPVRELGFPWLEVQVLSFLGPDVLWKLAGIFAGGAVIFVLGVVDDLIALKPEIKLIGQVASALILVLCGIRLDLFMPGQLWFTIPITVLWVVGMANSMNFLDNMDGLCGGVSAIAALSFFACLAPHNDTFVCVMLLVFAGSVAGFLYHNLNPARIFMGDAGSMFSGYILATAAILGTFYDQSTPSRVAVAAPLLALSVPIFDTITVVFIRWRNGESIMKGDKRHFSHRLVDAGMSPRQAVEFIFIVAAVNGLGAALLPQLSMLGTFIVIAQAFGVFMLIVLLMNTRKKDGPGA